MNAAVDGLEAVLVEAYKQKGWKWVSEEPLWVTWPLAKFGTCLLPESPKRQSIEICFSHRDSGYPHPLP